MGRTSTARDRLRDSACELLHTRGYAAVGVAEICARADVRKGSFYHFFESKQALTIEVIDTHWQAQRAAWRERLGGPEPAAGRLQRLIMWLVETQREAQQATGRIDGCLLGNLAIELSNQETAVQQRLTAAFDEQAELVHANLTEGAQDGSVAAEYADLATARAVVAQIEGAVLLAKLAGDTRSLDNLWPHVRRLVTVPSRR
ncbi:putative TetR-family transcriptional regulator [Actinoplanes missouriensis 431]|uniref:Putative TetR-family transcriptional regulator n=1 Tax=Actinoplanes missouriensis (strain ATCC 14538 / DSM 43046 / CBS 188.64 / JCM 3121 / NBRC 102363 / NCIMB 12654 / NRRL B-3342 / UNCC 431) TaxID=512565 RepID=I0H414_ACTM4|nr:TetR/AcrR family transcriptional regulator [Actinoplanes missouriensis]BAL87751.1 putative TetR-family transcriptional regulator [Actinoplanes missouriensis 431]